MDAAVELRAGAREGEEPWIVEHPQFKEMMALDVADSTQVYAAFLVYMDLLEVRNWNNVEILGSSELRIIYLCGKEKADSAPQVVIPTPITTSCSHERARGAADDSKIERRPKKGAVTLASWPSFTVSIEIPQKRIQQFLKLNHREGGLNPEDDQNGACSVLLAIAETDSTIVYYKLTEGFVIPDPPDFAEDVNNKRWKKKKLRSLR